MIHKRYNLKQSAIDFGAHLLTVDRIKQPNGSVIDKRFAATRLFSNLNIEQRGSEWYGVRNYRTKTVDKIRIYEGEGCHYIVELLRNGVKYQCSYGDADYDIFQENTIVTSEEISENTYLIDFSNTELNGVKIAEAKRNRDFRGVGFSATVYGLTRTPQNRYGKKHIGRNSHLGNDYTSIMISTATEGFEDGVDIFYLAPEELTDTNNEYLRVTAHTRSGALGKSKLEPLMVNLKTLCPKLYSND